MSRWVRNLILWLAGIVAVLVLGIVIGLTWLTSERARPLLEREASALAGRPVRFARLQLSLVPLEARLSDLKVEPMLSADAVTARLDARELWRGRLVLAEVAVEGVDVRVTAQEVEKEKRKEAEKPKPARPPRTRLPVAVERLTLRRLKAVASSGTESLQLAVDRLVARIPNEYLTTTAQAVGAVQRLPFSLGVEPAPGADGKPGGLQVSLAMPSLDLAALLPNVSALAGVPTVRDLDLRATLATPLGARASLDRLTFDAVRGDARLAHAEASGALAPKGEGREVRLRLALTAGRSDLESDVVAVLPGDAGRPRIAARVSSGRLDLPDLMALAPSSPKPAVTAAPSQAAKKKPWALPNQPLPFALLSRVDGSLTAAIGRLNLAAGAPAITQVQARADLAKGELHLARAHLATSEGEVEANGWLHGGGGVPRITLAANVRGIKVGDALATKTQKLPLASLHWPNLIEAHVSGTVALATAGRSIRDLVQYSYGNAELFAEGGYIAAVVVQAMGLNLTRAVGDLILNPPPETALQCFFANLGLARGQLVPSPVLLSTSAANLHLKGVLDLVTGKSNLVLDSAPKQFTVGSLHAPILIDGEIRAPRVHPEYREIVARAAAAAALGLLNPAAAALPLLEPPTGNKSICQAFQPEIDAASHAVAAAFAKGGARRVAH